MEITWYAQDGSINPRGHTVEVDDDELRECETDEERISLVEEMIQEEFEQTVYWTYDKPDFSNLGEVEDD